MGIHRVGSIQQLPGRPPVAAPVAPPAQPAAAAWGQDGASFGGVPPYATPPFVPQQPSPWGQTPPYPGVPQQPSPWGQTPSYPSVPQQPSPWGQTPSYPSAPQQPSPWGQTPSYPSVPQQPSPWGQTPPVAPGPTPAQVAEIQALMAEVARLQQQLDAILAMRPQPAPGWGTQPAGPTPGWGMQPTTPAFPMSVPPAPLPQAPLPVAPPLPAPPPVAPPLPAPPPVIPPAQTTPAPTPPSPTPPPVIPAPSQPTTARPGLLQLSGLPAGTRLRLAPGTSVKGFDVSGTAAIRESSPQVLDLIAKGSALFGLVRRTYGLRAEAQPDGRMKIALNEIGSDGRAKKSVFSGNLKVLDSRPGSLTLRDPDGKAGSITQGADGSLTIQHPEGTIKLYVTGRAPLIAGVDDVDNGQALA